MALHAVEERTSVSSKLGWEGSTLLQPAAELGAIAGLSLLIGALHPLPTCGSHHCYRLPLDGHYRLLFGLPSCTATRPRLMTILTLMPYLQA